MDKTQKVLLSLLVCIPSITYLIIGFPTPGYISFGGNDLYPYLNWLNPNAGPNLYCGTQPQVWFNRTINCQEFTLTEKGLFPLQPSSTTRNK